MDLKLQVPHQTGSYLSDSFQSLLSVTDVCPKCNHSSCSFGFLMLNCQVSNATTSVVVISSGWRKFWLMVSCGAMNGVENGSFLACLSRSVAISADTNNHIGLVQIGFKIHSLASSALFSPSSWCLALRCKLYFNINCVARSVLTR